MKRLSYSEFFIACVNFDINAGSVVLYKNREYIFENMLTSHTGEILFVFSYFNRAGKLTYKVLCSHAISSDFFYVK